ncbi:MAG: 2-C-methyl-D-erythritol 4-phosphate cytidylyltransferase [Clostridiales bacterium]|nr:2-C-methyl-D-erythritol 4-phosphate cytidylyltransferase [Clostridiales bacterium]
MAKTGAVIVAAGTGKRMGAAVPKQFILLKGKPILLHTAEKFEGCSEIDEIVVVTGKNNIELTRDILKNIKKLYAFVSGGAEGQNSVFNGLMALSADMDYVLIHDGVRPFIEPDDIVKIIEEVKVYKACVMGVKAKDTIKVCSPDGFVETTPDRSLLWNAQTPQAFELNTIKEAYNRIIKEGLIVTDDSAAAEYVGVKVKMTAGSYSNIKITTPEDLKGPDGFSGASGNSGSKGNINRRKTKKSALPKILGMLESKQLDVIIYISEHTDPDNLFIGTYRKIAADTKVSQETIHKVMKKLEDNNCIQKLQNGVYKVSSDIILK